jgi:hypothetical protein
MDGNPRPQDTECADVLPGQVYRISQGMMINEYGIIIK